MNTNTEYQATVAYGEPSGEHSFNVMGEVLNQYRNGFRILESFSFAGMHFAIFSKEVEPMVLQGPSCEFEASDNATPLANADQTNAGAIAPSSMDAIMHLANAYFRWSSSYDEPMAEPPSMIETFGYLVCDKFSIDREFVGELTSTVPIQPSPNRFAWLNAWAYKIDQNLDRYHEFSEVLHELKLIAANTLGWHDFSKKISKDSIYNVFFGTVHAKLKYVHDGSHIGPCDTQMQYLHSLAKMIVNSRKLI